jgi:multidrug efflux pump subunit AcrB
MTTIPLTVIGVFPGHWLLNQPVTATSIIGFVVLSGLVVRNALHLIDFILEHRGYKETVELVLVHAGESKFLAILLPTLITVLSSLIMLPDPVFNGLAISLIFGSLSSSFITLFLIPLMYLDYMKFKEYLKHRI